MNDEEVKTFIKTELETLEYFTLQLLKRIKETIISIDF